MVAVDQQAIQHQQNKRVEDNDEVAQKNVDADMGDPDEQKDAENRRADQIGFEVDAPV